jgi:hypothetical protein
VGASAAESTAASCVCSPSSQQQQGIWAFRIALGEVPDDEVERSLADVEMLSADGVALPGLALGGQVCLREKSSISVCAAVRMVLVADPLRRGLRRRAPHDMDGFELGGEPDDAHGHPKGRSRLIVCNVGATGRPTHGALPPRAR